MTDEIKLHKQRAAGLKAEKEWHSPVLQAIIAELEADVRNSWMESNADEKERREELYYFSRALQALKHRFQKRISDGKYAEKQLEERKQQLND